MVEGTGIHIFARDLLGFSGVPGEPRFNPYPEAKVFLTPLSHRPFDPTVQSRLREPREDQVDFPALLAPDPLIQQMVNRVSPTKIDQYWYDLVNNLPSGTRFTFSSGCRNAAAVYCHDQARKNESAVRMPGVRIGSCPQRRGTHVGAITNPNGFTSSSVTSTTCI